MNDLLRAEAEAADVLMESIGRAMINPRASDMAGTHLEIQLSVNGYLRALAFASDCIADYRRTLLLAIKEKIGS